MSHIVKELFRAFPIKKPKALENKGFRRCFLASQRGFEPPTPRLGELRYNCHICSPMFIKASIYQAFSTFRIASCSREFTFVVRCSPRHFSTFLDIEDELKGPSHKYTAPEGELLVATEANKVLGMVAYHRHSNTRCEMKRLYVRPTARGMHLVDTLVNEILAHAKKAGYQEIVLDTIVPPKAAISLYIKHGFEECEAYYYNPKDYNLY